MLHHVCSGSREDAFRPFPVVPCIMEHGLCRLAYILEDRIHEGDAQARWRAAGGDPGTNRALGTKEKEKHKLTRHFHMQAHPYSIIRDGLAFRDRRFSHPSGTFSSRRTTTSFTRSQSPRVLKQGACVQQLQQLEQQQQQQQQQQQGQKPEAKHPGSLVRARASNNNSNNSNNNNNHHHK